MSSLSSINALIDARAAIFNIGETVVAARPKSILMENRENAWNYLVPLNPYFTAASMRRISRGEGDTESTMCITIPKHESLKVIHPRKIHINNPFYYGIQARWKRT